MTMQKFTLAILLLFTVKVNGQPTLDARQKEAITELLYQSVNDTTPGLAVGIVKQGEVIYEHYLGYANLAHRIPVTENTRFNIASTAKQFTALMVLDMALKGQLSLEDDIRKYLPSLYPEVKEEIKIRHVLNHTSGIRDYVELLSLQDKIWWKQMGLDNDDIIELLEKQQELGFEPGSCYSYSNSGYVVLAELIERVSGERFTTYSKAFFQQLEMNQTAFVERYMGVIPNRADPYNDWGSGAWLQTPTITKTAGEGFLFTTLRDQLAYEQALQRVDQKNELLLKSQQLIPNSEIETYGFGLELTDWSGRAAVHHAGGTYGYQSQMIRFPDQDLAIFVMSNNGNIASHMIADQIVAIVLPAIPNETTPTYHSRYYETVSKTRAAPVLGQYVRPDGSVIRIVNERGITYWKTEGGARIELLEENRNRYWMRSDSTQKVGFYADSVMLFNSSGTLTAYERSNILPADAVEMEGWVGTYVNRELELSFELKLAADNQLTFLLSSWDSDEVEIVEPLNRNRLLVYHYVLELKRDAFNRVHEIRLSYDRAPNIRFEKQADQ